MGNYSIDKIIKLTECITDFVLLNIMWFAGCALGGVILGWAPSTVALLTVLRNKITKKDYYGVINPFWTTYKKEFKKSNILGSVITLFLIIISINKMNFEIQPELVFRVITTMSIIARIIVCTIGLYMFPLYVYYDMDLKNYFIKSFNILIMRPILVVCIALWTFLVYSIITMVPGLIAIFGVSIYFYGIMAINYQFFMRNEQRLIHMK